MYMKLYQISCRHVARASWSDRLAGTCTLVSRTKPQQHRYGHLAQREDLICALQQSNANVLLRFCLPRVSILLDCTFVLTKSKRN